MQSGLKWSDFKKMLDALSVEQVEKLIIKVDEYKNERIEREKAETAEKERKNIEIEGFLSEAKGRGISEEDILQYVKDKKGEPAVPKLKKPAKKLYRYIDAEGREHFWSGRGKTPLALLEVMKRDNQDKEFYKIKED